MPSYSNLGFKLIDTGTEQGIWGVSTNTNFQYLDSAIVGAVTIPLTVAGSAASPNDLNVADFSESSGRNRIITFSSASDLGATTYVRVTPNDFNGHYFIRNALTNNRALIIFQGTYNGITSYQIPNGKDVIIRCTGGGVNSTVYNVLDNLFTNAITTSSFETPSFSTSNVSAGTITANTSFVGPGTGLTGTANQLSANFANTTSTSTSTTNLTIAADNNTVSVVYPTIVSGSEGTLPLRVTPEKLSFTPSTGTLSVTSVASATFNVVNIEAATVNTNLFSSSDAVPEFNGTGAIDIPAGNSAQRPASPSTGMVRYNTELSVYEVYAADGTWKSLTAGSLSPSLGVGRAWSAPTRVLGTLYTNTTGRPVAVSISLTITNAQYGTLCQVGTVPQNVPIATVKVNGVEIISIWVFGFYFNQQIQNTAFDIAYEEVNFVVPSGQTYQLLSNLTSQQFNRVAVLSWTEL